MSNERRACVIMLFAKSESATISPLLRLIVEDYSSADQATAMSYFLRSSCLMSLGNRAAQLDVRVPNAVSTSTQFFPDALSTRQDFVAVVGVAPAKSGFFNGTDAEGGRAGEGMGGWRGGGGLIRTKSVHCWASRYIFMTKESANHAVNQI